MKNLRTANAAKFCGNLFFKTTLPVLGLLAICLLTQTGCVGVIPVPSFSNQPVAGQVIKPGDVKFIVPGQTTRAVVVERLGTSFRASPRMPVLAYSWELPGGSGIWWWCVFSPYFAAGDINDFEWSRWRAFFVTFDEQGVVTKAEFVHLSGKKSLDEQLEDWGARIRRDERSH
jgi:hypothetical protein